MGRRRWRGWVIFIFKQKFISSSYYLTVKGEEEQGDALEEMERLGDYYFLFCLNY
jgi:hypothetical protein